MNHPVLGWATFPVAFAVWLFGLIGDGTAAQIAGLGVTAGACLLAVRVVSKGYAKSDEVTAGAVERLTAELKEAREERDGYRVQLDELWRRLNDKPVDPEADIE